MRGNDPSCIPHRLNTLGVHIYDIIFQPIAHLRGLVVKGRKETFQQPAHRLHHADRRDRHEWLHLAFLEHL